MKKKRKKTTRRSIEEDGKKEGNEKRKGLGLRWKRRDWGGRGSDCDSLFISPNADRYQLPGKVITFTAVGETRSIKKPLYLPSG